MCGICGRLTPFFYFFDLWRSHDTVLSQARFRTQEALVHGNIDAFDVLRSSRGDAAFVQGTAVGVGIVAPFTCPCIED
jgi:hypothetical protein